MQQARAQILLVEDDEFAVMLFEAAAAKVGLDIPVTVAGDGEQALDILRGDEVGLIANLPVVVILDINMPRMDGHEFLAELRGDPALMNTPVFMLTTSDRPDDVNKAYGKKIAGYCKKTAIPEFFETVTMFKKYCGQNKFAQELVD